MDSAPRIRSVGTVSHLERPSAPRGRSGSGELVWKHRIDRIAAAVLIVLVSPLIAALALAAKLSSGGPVLVRDRRVTREGGSFDLLAFRPLPRLERWPIDRLPELFNVVKGEMSFVGPRPERPEFVELFGEHLRRYEQPRHVRPGVTGWAQMRGLDGPAPLAERVRWDDFYVENWSLWLDLRILALTFRGALRG